MRWATLIALVMLGSLAASPAKVVAQPPVDPLHDLRIRLDALERENQALKAAVFQPPPAHPDYTAHVGIAPPPGPDKVFAAGGELPGSVVGEDLAMTARWNHGLELATKDKAFRVHVGGRWQFDSSWFSADQAVQNNLPGGVMYHDGADFRRARLRVDGTMYETIDFAAEYDFINSVRSRNAANSATTDFAVPAITDLWLQYSHTPIGHIRVGNQKEAIGFEHLVSSRFLPFMERSYNQDTFYGGAFNGFTPGAQVFDTFWDNHASYHLGVFKPTDNVFGASVNDGDYAVTGRLTWLPIYECEGRQLIHLGISGRQATTFNDRIRFRTRDAMRAGLSVQWPVPADVTVLGSEMQWINAELAAVQGPWTFQAEWLTSFTQNARLLGPAGGTGPLADPLFYQGGYVQLLYFLTGESDNYHFERASFDRVTPHENFFWVPGDGGSFLGTGAWQLGARYNYLDLNDQDINGGILHNFTAGLNWFFNPNTKWQFNYIATYRDVSETITFPDGSGWIHGWGMRFAQDF